MQNRQKSDKSALKEELKIRQESGKISSRIVRNDYAVLSWGLMYIIISNNKVS